MPFRLLCQDVAGVALSTSLTACHMSTTSCRHAGYRCAVGTAVLGFSVLPWNRCARGVNRRTAVKKTISSLVAARYLAQSTTAGLRLCLAHNSGWSAMSNVIV